MKKILKWLGIVVGVLVVVVIVAIGATYLLSSSRLNKTYDVQPAVVTIPTDEASIQEGERLAISRGCVDCHGKDLSGGIVVDSPPTGRIAAANLTSGQGGVGANREDIDWVRAIRHGVGIDGKPLVFMPSFEFYYFNDDDLGKIIAYLKQVPPVDNELPPSSPGPLFRVLFLTGQLPLLASAELIDHHGPRPAAVEVGQTEEYGEYLAVGCIGCHGDNYSGGPIPGMPPDTPPAANLTPDPSTGLGSWAEEDFMVAMREGKRPDGTAIDPFMPWPNFSQLTDEELGALWLYLQSLPAKPYGNR